MARLQRKKPVTAKKKKQQTDTSTSGKTAALTAKSVDKSSTPVTKKKSSVPARRTTAPAKGESPGKVKGIVDQSIQFLREVKVELKKVAWPSRKQTLGSTAVVLILVFIISAFLGIVDMGLSSLVRLVLQ